MILSYEAYATRMSTYWSRIVTREDYARYVDETLADLAIAARAHAELVALTA